MDGGAWRATVHGVAGSDMTDPLTLYIRKGPDSPTFLLEGLVGYLLDQAGQRALWSGYFQRGHLAVGSD